ncbi:MAG: histidine phosphatase family protein [Candidatus Niyogibacteria bacterium]|nr:histidine phosphatase family protein [Candidatus Niyogibacteria bacterium]
MTLPIDLVFIRHGESEGNIAKRQFEDGSQRPLPEGFRERHTASFRLTNRGRAQAIQAGAWLRTEFGAHHPLFDRFLTSEYIRAKETAALLTIPDARWYADFNLAERDGGNLRFLDDEEWRKEWARALELRDAEPFFWRPPNGESFAALCQRLRSPLGTWHRECADKRVLAVCHGEVMWGIRILRERMPQRRFRELHLSKDPADRIYNCQILHYTRRDPESGQLARYANWMRMIRPTENPVWTTGWRSVVRPQYSNADLLTDVEQTPVLIAE